MVFNKLPNLLLPQPRIILDYRLQRLGMQAALSVSVQRRQLGVVVGLQVLRNHRLAVNVESVKLV